MMREDLLDQARGEAHRRLVEQDQLGPRHEGASNREHLLLAARQRAGLGRALFRKRREERVHVVKIGSDLAVGAAVGAEPQIVGHRQRGEDLPSLRDLGDAAHDAPVRRKAVDRLPCEANGAAGHRLHARDRAQQRGLAGAVRSHQGHDLAGGDLERDAVQHLDAAVAAGEILDREHTGLREGAASLLARLRRAVRFSPHNAQRMVPVPA